MRTEREDVRGVVDYSRNPPLSLHNLSLFFPLPFLFVIPPNAHTSPTDGKVYCWGSNSHGELGRISKHTHKPRDVAALPSNIVSIHCGDQRCCATTSDGFCFIWGRLSSKDLLKDNHVPMLIDVFDGKEDVWVRDGACGRTHFAVLEDAKLSHALSQVREVGQRSVKDVVFEEREGEREIHIPCLLRALCR